MKARNLPSQLRHSLERLLSERRRSHYLHPRYGARSPLSFWIESVVIAVVFATLFGLMMAMMIFARSSIAEYHGARLIDGSKRRQREAHKPANSKETDILAIAVY